MISSNDLINLGKPISVASRYKTCFYDLSLHGIAGSNPILGMDILLLGLSCVVRRTSLRRTDH